MNKNKHFESKKFTAFIVGCSITTLFVVLSLLLMFFVPNVAAEVVGLMTVALGALNGMISIYAIGQSAVDWQIESKSNSEVKVEKYFEEKNNFQMKYD